MAQDESIAGQLAAQKIGQSVVDDAVHRCLNLAGEGGGGVVSALGRGAEANVSRRPDIAIRTKNGYPGGKLTAGRPPVARRPRPFPAGR